MSSSGSEDPPLVQSARADPDAHAVVRQHFNAIGEEISSVRLAPETASLDLQQAAALSNSKKLNKRPSKAHRLA